MAQEPTPPTRTPATKKTAAAADTKGRINIHRFKLGGYIEVNARDTKTIVKAADAYNAAVEGLKTAGAVIQVDDILYTSTTPGAEDEDSE